MTFHHIVQRQIPDRVTLSFSNKLDAVEYLFILGREAITICRWEGG